MLSPEFSNTCIGDELSTGYHKSNLFKTDIEKNMSWHKRKSEIHVTSWKKLLKFLVRRKINSYRETTVYDNNDCTDGKIAGAF